MKQHEHLSARAAVGENARSASARRFSIAAFTLIELLVVISIIGVLAALIIPLSGVASSKMRTARVKAELNNLVTAIEGYKQETGQYPPDHGDLRTLSATDPRYKDAAAMNPLYYELSGAVFTNGEFRVVGVNEVIKPETLKAEFKRDGIRNSARSRAQIDYKGFSARDSQYAELERPSNVDVEILIVPVSGPFVLDGRGGKKLNPWFYDASSTNRNNRNGYDIWAEFTVGKQTNVLGNWKN